jgi:hypothetical protein
MKTFSSRAFVNTLLVYSLVAIGCTGTVGLGMVWSRHQISELARENKALATRIAELGRQTQETSAEIAAQLDPVVLLQRNAQLHLGLVPPAPTNLFYSNQDPEMHLAAKHNEGLFADRPANVTFRVAAQP